MKPFYFISVCIGLFFLPSCVPVKKHALLKDTFESRVQDLKQVQREKESFVKSADSLRSDNELLKNEVHEIETAYYRSKQSLAEAEGKLREYNTRMQETESAKQIIDHYIPAGNKVIIHTTDTVSKMTFGANSGKVAFYCPRKMIYKETYDAFGLIADVISDNHIKAQIIKNIKQHERDTGNVNFHDDDLLIEKIQFYELLELRLDPASNNGFDILKVNGDDKQLISPGMEGWHWKITPVSTDEKQQLVLKVIVYDRNGNIDLSFAKTYHVDIKVNPFSFFHHTKLLFIENPEWAYGSVIFPLLTFLLGRYQKRKSNPA